MVGRNKVSDAETKMACNKGTHLPNIIFPYINPFNLI